MKKFFRFLLVVILIIIVVIIALGIKEPKKVTVQRTVMIDAPKNVVYEQVTNFKNWPHWSPWYQMDSTMQITYSGTDGQAGSSYHWVGNEKTTGEGDRKSDSVNDNGMAYEVHFLKPYKANGNGFMKIEKEGNGMVKATWSMTIHTPFPWNAMQIFYDADKMIGGDFERGLANLKKYAEAHKTDVIVTTTTFPGHTYATIRKTVGWADMSKYFMDTYGALGQAVGASINGPASAIFYTWDTAAHNSDCAAAFPVADTSKPVTGGMYVTVPSCPAYMVVHTGGYSSEMKDHSALMETLKANGKQLNFVVEEYIKGPHSEPDSNKWVTNIYYLVK